MLQYTAVLIQTGAVPPTANEGINTFGGPPMITRVDRGQYKLQFGNDLSIENTVLLLQITIDGYANTGSAFIEDGCVMIYCDNEASTCIISLDVRWFGV